jgi:hypothetical protein
LSPGVRQKPPAVKYVILKTRGLEVPILLPSVYQHREVVETLLGTPVSAGMVRMGDDGSIIAGGGSLSLGIESRPGDAELIQTHLRFRDI